MHDVTARSDDLLEHLSAGVCGFLWRFFGLLLLLQRLKDLCVAVVRLKLDNLRLSVTLSV